MKLREGAAPFTISRSLPESVECQRIASYIAIQPSAMGGACSSMRCRCPTFLREARIASAAAR